MYYIRTLGQFRFNGSAFHTFLSDYCILIIRRVLYPSKASQVAIVDKTVKSGGEEGCQSLLRHPPPPTLRCSSVVPGERMTG